ncbi:protein-tyrosine phosphatase-like protein [Mycena filopes]|nr:protein-tyrosine phosphatase-like protein [Mycena filopes]
MITFDSIPPEEMEAMCTPMHRVLSPVPILNTSQTPQLQTPTSTSTPTKGATKSASTKASISTPSTGALYLGSMAAVLEPDLLQTHDITNLVQVLEVPWAPLPPPAPPNGAGTTVPSPPMTYHRIDIEDRASAALTQHLGPACDYIHASLVRGENVLVHCQQGVSRSASIVIAYLIRERAMSYDAAFAHVKQRRQCIRPNSGFVGALRDWEIACAPTAASKPKSTSAPSLSVTVSTLTARPADAGAFAR